MKQTLSFVLFLVFTITTQSISSSTTTIVVAATTTATKDVIYDITGKMVLNDFPYHIGPVSGTNDGGVKLTDTKNNEKVCPLYAVQGPAKANLGDQFNFILLAKHKYLLKSYGLGIRAGSPKGSCDDIGFLKIADAEAKAPSNLITTGGLLDTAVSCFKVVDYPKPTSPKVHSYMLQHCPSFCGAGPHTCFNISIYEDKGVKYLASSGTPFEFVFQKAK